MTDFKVGDEVRHSPSGNIGIITAILDMIHVKWLIINRPISDTYRKDGKFVSSGRIVLYKLTKLERALK